MRGLCLILVAAAMVSGCAQQNDPVVAYVDGEPVHYRRFHRWVQVNAGQTPDGLEEPALAVLFEEMLDEICLIRLAEDSGFSTVGEDPRLGVARMVEALDEGRAPRTRPLVNEEGTETRSVGQILVLDGATAEALRAEILQGGDPREVALRWQGRGEGVLFGGIQHQVRASDLPPVYAAAVFALEPGGISEVLNAEYGNHLFFVPIDPAPTEVVVRSSLADVARRARDRYNVVLVEANLPFRPLSGESSDASSND